MTEFKVDELKNQESRDLDGMNRHYHQLKQTRLEED